PQVEIHIAQCGEIAERLRYPRQLQGRRSIGAIRAMADGAPHMAHDRVHCWLITPLTNQSMPHRSPSDRTSPDFTRSLPSRSASGPAYTCLVPSTMAWR